VTVPWVSQSDESVSCNLLSPSEGGGLVLAAGASTRMGSPKALVELGGITALARIVATLRQSGVEPLVVVVADDHAVAAEARSAGAAVVVNATAASGRTGSIQAGLRALPPERLALVAPVDCPLVRASTVRALLARAGEAALVRPRFAGRAGHPIVLAAAARDAVLALPPDAPLREWARGATRLDVDVDDEEILANLDTPADAALARERLARRGG